MLTVSQILIAERVFRLEDGMHLLQQQFTSDRVDEVNTGSRKGKEIVGIIQVDDEDETFRNWKSGRKSVRSNIEITRNGRRRQMKS